MRTRPTKAREHDAHLVETLKARLLGLLYALGLLALAYVILGVLAMVKHAVILLTSAILLAYLIAPAVLFFSHPISIPIPARLRRSPSPPTEPEVAEALGLPPSGTLVVTRQGLPWVTSILVVYGLILTAAYFVVSYVVPLVMNEVNHLSANWPQLSAQGHAMLQRAEAWLIERLPAEEREAVPFWLSHGVAEATTWVQNQAHYLPPLLTKLVGTVAGVFIVPIMTFYLLADIERLRGGFLDLFPQGRRTEITELLGKVDSVLGQFIRGQLLVALVLGSSITLLLVGLGVPYSLTVGMFAGVFSLIPYMGPVIGGVPAAFIAFATGGMKLFWFTVGGMYLVHLFEGKVVVPTIVGRSVGLPPVLIMVSIISGAELAGVIGLLIAVPVLGIVRVLVSHLLHKRDQEESKVARMTLHDLHPHPEGDSNSALFSSSSSSGG